MTVISSSEIHVIELNGFLNGLRCSLGISTRKFGATSIPRENKTLREISEEVVNSNPDITGVLSKELSSYENIKGVFETEIYKNHVNLGDDSLTNLDWNLVEYYGLIATSENPEGKWNPLISEYSYLFEIETSSKQRQKLFFVEYEKFVVMTWL